MNSIQMMLPGSSQTDQPVSAAVRGKRDMELAVAKGMGSFHKRLQEARQAKTGNVPAKEKKETGSNTDADQTSSAQTTVDTGVSTTQTQSAQPDPVEKKTDQEGADAAAGDSTASINADSSISDSLQNLINLVLAENPVVDASKTPVSPLLSTQALETTQSTDTSGLAPAATAPVATAPVVPSSEVLAALSSEVPTVMGEKVTVDQTKPQVDTQMTVEPQVLTSQTGQAAQTVAEEQSPKTSDNRKTDVQDQDLPVIQIAPQSDRTTAKDQTVKEQSSEVKRIMDMESQRLSLNPLNTREQKDGDTQNPSKSDDSSSMAAFTHHPQVDLTKISFKQALDSQSVLRQQTPDAQDIMSQVVQKAELMLKQGSSEMNIQLKPDLLGKMTIKVSMEDGVVTARFTTENQQVKNILDQNIQSLRQNLEAQGMKVDKTEVNIQMDSGGMFGGFGGRQQDLWQQQQGAQYSGMTTSQTGETATATLGESPVYSQLDKLYGSSSDSIDYRI